MPSVEYVRGLLRTSNAKGAADLLPIQEAAFLAATWTSAAKQLTELASDYMATTRRSDGCENYEAYLRRTTSDLTRSQLYILHITRFGCDDLSRHTTEVVRLARVFLSFS